MSTINAAGQKVSKAPLFDGTLEAQSENIQNLAEISQNAKKTFFAILIACAYSYLTIGSTTDTFLLTNSSASPLPIIQVRVPIVWFYIFAPSLLFLMHIYFHLYLERFWRSVAVLPIFHKDGRSLDDYIYPWLIPCAILRAQIPELGGQKQLLVRVEAILCEVLAWWSVPITLLFFWIRYLTRHDWVGTTLHIIFLSFAVGTALGFFLSAHVYMDNLSNIRKSVFITFIKFRILFIGLTVIFISVMLFFISFGTIEGAPIKHCESLDSSQCSWIYSGVRILEFAGYNPFAGLEEQEVSKISSKWRDTPTQKKSMLGSVIGADLAGQNLRHVRGKDAFFVNADLRNADLRWANLEHARFQGAHLENANIQSANLNGAQLQWGNMEQTNFEKADLYKATLVDSYLTRTNYSQSILARADLKNAVGRETNFSGADLRYAKFTNSDFSSSVFERAQLQRAYLNEAYFERVNFRDATLQHADLSDSYFTRTDFSKATLYKTDLSNTALYKAIFDNAKLMSAKFEGAKAEESSLLNADLKEASLKNSYFSQANFREADLTDADLSGADLRKADFTGAVLTRTLLQDAVLSGSILIGSKGLTQKQLEKACGNQDTILPSNLNVPACHTKKQSGE